MQLLRLHAENSRCGAFRDSRNTNGHQYHCSITTVVLVFISYHATLSCMICVSIPTSKCELSAVNSITDLMLMRTSNNSDCELAHLY